MVESSLAPADIGLDAPPPLWVAACTRNGRAGALAREGGRLELRAAGDPPPQSAALGSCRVLFAGVLYNADELRQQVPALGRQDAAGGQDAASVIATAYMHYGDDLIGRLRGRFAVLIEDQRRDELLLARDPMGMYPLFYADCGDELLVSPGLDDLVRQPGVGSALNRAALANHLCGRWPDREETFYAAIKRVPPGWALRIGRGAPLAYRHWRLPNAWSEVDWLHEDEVGRFDFLLDQAVARCLRGAPAGIYLSGGIDSVSVAVSAAESCVRNGKQPPLALSLAFPDPDTDEVHVQQAVARGLGMPQVMAGFDETVGSEGLVSAGLELSRRTPAPLNNFWLPAFQRLGLEGRRRGCRVLLTGEGGDEWLTVTPLLAADLIRRGRVDLLWRLFANSRRSFRLSTPAMAFSLFWRFGLRPVLGVHARALLERTAPRVLGSRWSRQVAEATPPWLAPDPVLRSEVLARAAEARSQPLSREHYLAELQSSLDHPLVAMDREEVFDNGRRLGAAVLAPYFDADLVELLFSTPPELLNRGGLAKGVVRERLSERFPDLGFDRQKKVSATTFATRLLMQQLPAALRVSAPLQALGELGIVDAPLLEAELHDAICHPQLQRGMFAWYALSTESWLRCHA